MRHEHHTCDRCLKTIDGRVNHIKTELSFPASQDARAEFAKWHSDAVWHEDSAGIYFDLCDACYVFCFRAFKPVRP